MYSVLFMTCGLLSTVIYFHTVTSGENIIKRKTIVEYLSQQPD